MWKSSYRESKRLDGKKIGKAVFWEVGDLGRKPRTFKRTFSVSLEHSTPRKAYDTFIRRLAEDEDFRNQFYLDHGWPAEGAWIAKQEEKAREAAKNIEFGFLFNLWRSRASAEWSAKYKQLIDTFWRELQGMLEPRKPAQMTKLFLAEIEERLRSKGNSRATINRKLRFVCRIMNYAMRTELIDRNPLYNFKVPKDPKPKTDFWTEEEANHFLAVADSRYPSHSPDRWKFVAYLLTLSTGVRANELWALRPRSMRPQTKTLWLSDQWSPLESKFIPLKSKDKGEGREVPMNDLLYRELLALQQAQRLGPDDLFFKINGKPVDQSHFSSGVWKTDLRRSGNRQIRFHDLRHSAATLMRRSGATRDEVRVILGHTDAKTTARYDHAADDSASRVAEKFALKPQRLGLRLVGE